MAASNLEDDRRPGRPGEAPVAGQHRRAGCHQGACATMPVRLGRISIPRSRQGSMKVAARERQGCGQSIAAASRGCDEPGGDDGVDGLCRLQLLRGWWRRLPSEDRVGEPVWPRPRRSRRVARLPEPVSVRRTLPIVASRRVIVTLPSGPGSGCPCETRMWTTMCYRPGLADGGARDQDHGLAGGLCDKLPGASLLVRAGRCAGPDEPWRGTCLTYGVRTLLSFRA